MRLNKRCIIFKKITTVKKSNVNFWQKKSETLDFTEADRIPDGEFNKIIWYAVKGLDVEYPGTRRAAFLKVIEDEE